MIRKEGGDIEVIGKDLRSLAILGSIDGKLTLKMLSDHVIELG